MPRAEAPSGRVDRGLIDALPNLEIISSFGVGYDHVDAAHAGTKGIVVTNTPDVLTDEVADLTLGLLLATLRKLPQADRYLREGRWLEKTVPAQPHPARTPRSVSSAMAASAGRSRNVSTGSVVTVVYHGRHEQADAPHRYYADLEAMAQDADTLIVITPGGKGTEKLVDARIPRGPRPARRACQTSRVAASWTRRR